MSGALRQRAYTTTDGLLLLRLLGRALERLLRGAALLRDLLRRRADGRRVLQDVRHALRAAEREVAEVGADRLDGLRDFAGLDAGGEDLLRVQLLGAMRVVVFSVLNCVLVMFYGV